MIGLDINVLAHYYIQDEADAEASKQREAARRLLESGKPFMVCKTVLLQLEWVKRGYYKFSTAEITAVMNHLLALPQVTFEDRESIVLALSHREAGLELADALHHGSYRTCDSMASFDDKHFARRARRMGLAPLVVVPGQFIASARPWPGRRSRRICRTVSSKLSRGTTTDSRNSRWRRFSSPR